MNRNARSVLRLVAAALNAWRESTQAVEFFNLLTSPEQLVEQMITQSMQYAIADRCPSQWLIVDGRLQVSEIAYQPHGRDSVQRRVVVLFRQAGDAPKGTPHTGNAASQGVGGGGVLGATQRAGGQTQGEPASSSGA